jgi:CubicO group peptidase (beta-lactamase class C family)
MAIANSHETIRCETAAPPDGSEQVAPDSIFLLASITKPVIGTAIVQLAEQGRLLISDPVARYVPEFGRFGKDKVTIWHLLTHTSGLAEEVEGPAWEAKAPLSAHLEAAYNSFLHFPPGTQYEYCNLSFWVLTEIITRVSGESYIEYLRHHIFEPLGMDDTAFDFEGEQAGRMMPVHNVQPLPGDGDLHYWRSLAHPAGGLWSTAADLVKFGQAMLNGLAGQRHTIVSRAGIAAMTRLHTAGLRDRTTGELAYYGLCWGKPGGNAQVLSVLADRPGGTSAAFGHGGATATLLWIEPDHDLVFVFLTNVWGQENRVAYAALNAVLGAM